MPSIVHRQAARYRLNIISITNFYVKNKGITKDKLVEHLSRERKV